MPRGTADVFIEMLSAERSLPILGWIREAMFAVQPVGQTQYDIHRSLTMVMVPVVPALQAFKVDAVPVDVDSIDSWTTN